MYNILISQFKSRTTRINVGGITLTVSETPKAAASNFPQDNASQDNSKHPIIFSILTFPSGRAAYLLFFWNFSVHTGQYHVPLGSLFSPTQDQ